MERRGDTLRVTTDREIESSSRGAVCAARMFNLSTTGCALRAVAAGLEVGDPLRINSPGVTSISGTVIWTREGCAGVAFAEPLHGAVVMYLGFEAEAGVTIEDLRNDQVDGALPSPGQAERKSPPFDRRAAFGI
jgi:hypothetical protein